MQGIRTSENSLHDGVHILHYRLQVFHVSFRRRVLSDAADPLHASAEHAQAQRREGDHHGAQHDGRDEITIHTTR